jgi:hypothetical protein
MLIALGKPAILLSHSQETDKKGNRKDKIDITRKVFVFILPISN